MSDLIRIRRGTSAEWASANPVLRSGEPGIDLTTDTLKIGDGTTAWSSLPAIGGGGGGGGSWGSITGTLSSQTDLQTALDAKQDDLVSGTTIKTVNGNTLLGSGNLVVTGAESFETVSKNLQGQDATLSYSGGNLSTIVYSTGVTKTLNYTGDNLTSVVLSGTTPGGIDLTKTLSYTGSDLTGVAYS